MPYSFLLSAGKRAADQRRQALNLEEEKMTQYTPADLDGEWEFKIVRSDSPVFRKQKTLDKLVEEEARAGWSMLEKLDDYRVRFKRPTRARGQDAYLPDDVDPYRTQYGSRLGSSSAIMALIVVGLLLLGVLGALVFMMRSSF